MRSVINTDVERFPYPQPEQLEVHMKILNAGTLFLAALSCIASVAQAQGKDMQTERPVQNKANNPHIEAREEAKREHMKKLKQDQYREDAKQRKDADMKRPESGG